MNQAVAEVVEDTEAERAVLGAVLVDNELFPTVAELLKPDDFYRRGNRLIFIALQALAGESKPLDILALRDELRRKSQLDEAGGISYIAALVDGIPKASNVAHYAAIVTERALARALTLAARRIISDMADSGDPAPEVLDRAEQAVFALASLKRTRRGFDPALDASREVVTVLEAVYAGKKIRGVPYGLTDLDRMTCGMGQSDLVIIAARPSVGKSAFALHVARAAAKASIPTAILSLEMSRVSLMLRMISAEGAVDMWRVMNTHAMESDWEAIASANERLASVPLWIDDSPSATMLELRARARRLKAESGLGLLIVDYLQLMTGKRQENRQQEVADMSRGLKALARDLDIPVVALSQLKRTEDRPRLSDLRESGAIEQDADTVLALFREENVDPSNPGPVEVIVLKQRNGPTGTVKVHFDPSLQRFGDFMEGEAR